MSVSTTPSPAPADRQRGFSFIEVIMALGILVLGSVSVLVLFAMGVNAQVRRRIDERARQVRPEIAVILQTAVDDVKPGTAPPPLKDVPLSQEGYSLDVEWTMDPFGGNTPVAYAYLKLEGERVKGIGPRPIIPSTLDPSLFGKGNKK